MPTKKKALEALITHENYHDYPYEEYFKFSANGEYCLTKREFENGVVIYSCHYVDDPGQNESPISRQRYWATRSGEHFLGSFHPTPIK
jgi:hypothetical protein